MVLVCWVYRPLIILPFNSSNQIAFQLKLGGGGLLSRLDVQNAQSISRTVLHCVLYNEKMREAKSLATITIFINVHFTCFKIRISALFNCQITAIWRRSHNGKNLKMKKDTQIAECLLATALFSS